MFPLSLLSNVVKAFFGKTAISFFNNVFSPFVLSLSLCHSLSHTHTHTEQVL